MKRSSGREFFEVFRRLRETEKSKSWWAKQSSAAATQKPKTATLSPARDTTTPPGRLKLTFSQEALAIMGVTVALALVASFVWGYKYGAGNRTVGGDASAVAYQTEAPQASAPTRPMTLAVTQAPSRQGPFYALQVISGISLQQARVIAADLRAMGYDAFAFKSSRTHAVGVGRYPDKRTADATQLKQTFDTMVYRNNQWFRSCMWVKISDTGSIVQ